MFAQKYIQNNVVYDTFIQEPVHPELAMIVVIPCLNEPEILRTLESLWSCTPVKSYSEVIVVVNDSTASSPEVKTLNQETFRNMISWKRKNDRSNLVLYPIYVPSVNEKIAGAGMTRKIGMDEAIRRFDEVNRADGIIVSLDADCLVSTNYLQRIESVFATNKSCFAATINFRHRFEEMDDPKQNRGIRLYEEYLHYYKRSVDYTGFPNSIYTIGSAFAVRADAYVKQGGMNRRKAGEDFYFLHKLTRLGSIPEISDAFVFPSCRISNRVPFGTGAAMTKWMNDTEDLTLTYNFAAFTDLKQLFGQVDQLFRIRSEQYCEVLISFPNAVREYLETLEFESKLAEINQNSSSPETFRKRFFQFFDAFIILRFLNFSHQAHYSRQKLIDAMIQLQKYSA